ncbi:DUF4349 domain-containing protein [Evansella sp. AB-P1]|uniref:DUF4349 domain-containing protein n=1 Tax=Evansella sp. AB-P1 TaxID=3037653 RepID=UPI00241DF1BE|nr:DUF4349 domain-containing protein [Evansella sp. AB-P1]MDG5787748.1 DUF4349 domain-containing protein [Evansella sp. AB-P1]
MNKQIKRYLTISLFVLLSTFFLGCSDRDNSLESSADNDSQANMNDSAGFVEYSRDYEGEMAEDGRSNTSNQEVDEQNLSTRDTTEQMIIYNGNLSIEVIDFKRAQADIQENTEQLGGYIVESSIYHHGEDRLSGNLVVRIPQEHFHSFLNDMESTSTKVLERTIHGNNVTEEYIDLESRLRSKEAVEERLLLFMEEAENTEDLLKISNDLTKIQEEIERLKGRMNYLENNVAFSTVTIYINEKTINVSSIQETDSLNTWLKSKSLFADTVNALISFFSGVIIFTIGLSPILIPLIIIICFIIVYQKRKLKKTKKMEQDN